MCPPAPNADLSGLRRISPYPSRWSIIQNIVNAQPERAGQSGLLPFSPIVLIKGAGDLATGAAVRLQRSGFAVVMTEIERPLAVRRMAAFAQAVFDGSVRIEDVRGVRCTPDEVDTRLAAGDIPILVDPEAQALRLLRPAVLVDAIMAKRNTGTRRDDAPYVIALGPGFRAGEDCHAVIETNRGHFLGRVIRQGGAQPDTGNPGVLPALRLTPLGCCAPVDGFVVPSFEIGDRIEPGQTVAAIQGTNGETAPVVAVRRHSARPCASLRARDRGHEDRRPRPARRALLLLHRVRQIACHRRRRAGSDPLCGSSLAVAAAHAHRTET